MPNTLDVLRSQTRSLHVQLEARFDLQQALSSRAEYRKLLELYVGLYRPFERTISSQPSEVQTLIGWPASRRVPLIELDLRALGVQESELATIPECTSLPALGDLDALFGAMYVIEGSALGGQIIYRQVEADLHLDHLNGAAFFFGEGPNTGAAWKGFTVLLEAHVSDAQKAAATACAMFKSFEDWLTKEATLA